MVERMTAFMVVLIGTLALSGCAESRSPDGFMGNTNWLTACQEDADCDDGLSCICGVCTRECDSVSDCSGLPDAQCDSGSLASPGAAECETPSAPDVCLSAVGNDEGMSAACGPTGAFITANLAPNERCEFTTDDARLIPIGLFDIRDGEACTRPYSLALLVNSCLRGESDILQLHSAEVRLTDIDEVTIFFDRTDPPLPNPFLVTTNNSIFPPEDAEPSQAIALVEAIPSAYAEQLDGFSGQQVLAEVTVFGTTVGDMDVDVRSFVYPINLCDGCLTLCASDIPPGTSREEIYGGECPDDAAADGRICVDEGEESCR